MFIQYKSDGKSFYLKSLNAPQIFIAINVPIYNSTKHIILTTNFSET